MSIGISQMQLPINCSTTMTNSFCDIRSFSKVCSVIPRWCSAMEHYKTVKLFYFQGPQDRTHKHAYLIIKTLQKYQSGLYSFIFFIDYLLIAIFQRILPAHLLFLQ